MRRSGILSSRPSQHVPRRLRSVRLGDIVPTSLEDTLTAHRASNRNSLIRKTYPNSPVPGLLRPQLPPENWAGYKPPEHATSPNPPEPEKPKRRARKRREATASNPATTPEVLNPVQLADPSSHELPAQSPWLRDLPVSTATGDASMRLDAELRSLDRYLAPNPREQTQINRLIAQITSLLEDVVPHSPQLAGLHRMGLALPHSSVNLFLRHDDSSRPLDNPRGPSPTRPQIKKDHSSLLGKVKTVLKSSDLFHGGIHLSERGIPVALTARHRETNLLLRFHCGGNVPAISEYFQDYLVEYPALRPLYMAARVLLEANGLCGSSRGSISPDALALLVVVFLKTTHGQFPGPNRLGDQFLAFLKLYGRDLDLLSVGVAVDPPGFFDAKTLRARPEDNERPAFWRGLRSLVISRSNAAAKGNLPGGQKLCIQDPTHYMRNLGHSCTRVVTMQGVFAAAHDRLAKSMSEWSPGSEDRSIVKDGLQTDFSELEKNRGRTGSAIWKSSV